MENKKKEIGETIHYFTGWELEGDMLKTAKLFSNTKEWYKEEFPDSSRDITVFHRFTLSHNYRDGESDEFTIVAYRWETDEEYNKRLEKSKIASKNAKKANEAKQLKKLEQELKLFKKLQAKYGK